MEARLNMANRYSVEQHPRRRDIERSIIDGVPYGEIAKNFGGLTSSSVRRYAKDRMPEIMAVAKLEQVDGILERIEDCIVKISHFFDSVTDWLSDPEDSGRPNFEPRASEMNVTVEIMDKDESKAVRRRMTMQELVEYVEDREEGRKAKVLNATLAIQDPRVTMLKTADVLTRQLELLAKVKGQIVENRTTVLNVTADVSEIADIARKALEPYPEALSSFIAELQKKLEENDEEE